MHDRKVPQSEPRSPQTRTAARGNIVIAAGGTGGHLYPGIVLGRELAKKGFTPIFFIRRDDAAKDIVAKEGFLFHEIPISGMPRKISLRFFAFLVLLARGIARSISLLVELKPAATVGMGGYISFPVVLVAKLLGIPTLIHEQNYLPGLANKLLSRVASIVAVSFQGARSAFPAEKTVLTGNPIRSELFDVPSVEAYRFFALTQEKFTVLVFGGSQGASRVNRITIDTLELLAKIKGGIQFIHIAGKNDVSWVEDAYVKSGFTARVYPYLHEMKYAYAAADLVLSRSGASTVTELMMLGKEAILIPFPFATANHQEYNALGMEELKTAVMIREKDLTPVVLSAQVINSFTAYQHHAPPPPLPSALPQHLLAEEVAKLAGGIE